MFFENYNGFYLHFIFFNFNFYVHFIPFIQKSSVYYTLYK